MVKIEKRIKLMLLLTLVSFSSFLPLSLMSRGFLPLKTSAPSFSWQDTTFSTSFVRVWDGDSSIFNYSSSYEDIFHTNSHYYNETEDTWTRGISTTDYRANYSTFSNITIVGNITVDFEVDIYRVNAQYKNVLDMYWFALKNGTYDLDYYLDQWIHSYVLNESYAQETVTNYTKFNFSTWEVLDTWVEYSNESGVKNTYQPPYPRDYREHKRTTTKFTKPIIIVSQLFTTKNKDKFAWAELYSDFFLFKEKNKDGIYNAGSIEGSTDFPSLYGSDEWYGVLEPIAQEVDYFYEKTFPNDSPSNYNASFQFSRPNDTTVEEIASNIAFTPPSLDENDIISWEVIYPQHPILASIHGAGVDDFQTGATFASMAPTNFSYKYDYNVSNTEANLDFTFGMSKINEPGLYNAVQGLGLSIPHYNLFISSFNINEKNSKQLTVPSSMFVFESNETVVAEINLINPKKVNYTLFDYPSLGIDSELKSYGGSLHKGILDMMSLDSHDTKPLLNLIYILEDTVAADPTFTNVDSLYHLETQNYPVWSGEKLLHDPTSTVYFDPQEEEQEPPTIPTPTTIPGFNVMLVVTVSTVVVAIKVAKTKNKQKKP